MVNIPIVYYTAKKRKKSDNDSNYSYTTVSKPDAETC